MAELVKKFDVHANQISDWKKQLLSGAPDVLGKGVRKAEDSEDAVQALQVKVGQLTRACPMSEAQPMSGASALAIGHSTAI